MLMPLEKKYLLIFLFEGTLGEIEDAKNVRRKGRLGEVHGEASTNPKKRNFCHGVLISILESSMHFEWLALKQSIILILVF